VSEKGFYEVVFSDDLHASTTLWNTVEDVAKWVLNLPDPEYPNLTDAYLQHLSRHGSRLFDKARNDVARIDALKEGR
jgi:hypothetical protein